MTKQRTLVILAPGFASSEEDTVCLPMQQDLVHALNVMFPDLAIIILSFQYPYRKQSYSWFGNKVISFNGRNRGGLHRLLLRRQILGTIGKLRETNYIMGMLSFWYGECALVGKKANDRYAIPHRCWILGQDARQKNRYPRRISLPATELVALSDFLQDEFERNHAIRPFTVLPPGIDIHRMDTTIQERDIDLLAAGSLIPLKQFHLFLDVVTYIKKHLPTVRAVIIGEGEERARLTALIATADLQKEVLLTGELPYNEVLRFMRRTKLFLHPSSYEGFSGVCLEAVSAGAQVISFCRPMKTPIKNWQIAATVDEMSSMAKTVLLFPSIDHSQVMDFMIEDTARKVLALFE